MWVDWESRGLLSVNVVVKGDALCVNMTSKMSHIDIRVLFKWYTKSGDCGGVKLNE